MYRYYIYRGEQKVRNSLNALCVTEDPLLRARQFGNVGFNRGE